jgi:hypothetical protein
VKIHVGAGEQALAGFVNVDIRPLPGVDLQGHAGDLRRFADGTAELIFGHAFLEHLFVAHHPSVFREWQRVLAPDGALLVIGIPDFAAIARLYVSGAPGVVGPRFDLYNVYRYTHGIPEIGAANVWSQWDPGRQPDQAPAGWLPQLHKGLFDTGYLYALADLTALDAAVFAYAFPGEVHVLNLAMVAVRAGPAAEVAGHRTVTGVRSLMGRVPGVERYVDLKTLEARSRPEGEQDLMLEYLRAADRARP